MKRNMRLYVEDILESLVKIEEYTKNIDEMVFYKKSELQDAVLRRLEIIGEASKHISEDFRKKYPDIPWKEMAGMRDILIHEYFGVNLKRVWKVVKDDISDLKNKVLKVRKDLRGNELF